VVKQSRVVVKVHKKINSSGVDDLRKQKEKGTNAAGGSLEKMEC
jgi:hypothetical protein